MPLNKHTSKMHSAAEDTNGGAAGGKTLFDQQQGQKRGRTRGSTKERRQRRIWCYKTYSASFTGYQRSEVTSSVGCCDVRSASEEEDLITACPQIPQIPASVGRAWGRLCCGHVSSGHFLTLCFGFFCSWWLWVHFTSLILSCHHRYIFPL